MHLPRKYLQVVFKNINENEIGVIFLLYLIFKAYTFNDNNSKNVNITRNFAVKFQKNANESIRINRKEKVSILYPSTQLVSNVFKC